jgi:hypothetical protein
VSSAHWMIRLAEFQDDTLSVLITACPPRCSMIA